MKRIVLNILLCLFSLHVYSQVPTEYLNEAKYWVWRDRLVNDFMIPGTCTGCGIIFNKRGWNSIFGYPYDNPTGWYRGGFDINDEGFEIGKYLIVLATEWKLLRNSGLPTDKTELEIYYELMTIDRLDLTAEKYWSHYWPFDDNSLSNGATNGFMIRDDVFNNFLWHNSNIPQGYMPDAYKRFLYLNQGAELTGKYQLQNVLLRNNDQVWNPDDYLSLSVWNDIVRSNDGNNDGYPDNRGFSGAEAGIHSSTNPSTWDGVPYTNITGPTEYSQDNYIGLLQGLAAVYTLVDPGVYMNGMQLKAHASTIIHRIVTSIQENESDNISWLIDNPVTEKCAKGVFWDVFLDQPLRYDPFCNEGGSTAEAYGRHFALINNLYSTNPMPVSTLDFLPGFHMPNNSMPCILATLTGTRSEELVCIWIDNLPGDLSTEFKYLELFYCLLNNISIPQRGFGYYTGILNSKDCYPYFHIEETVNNEVGNFLTEMAIHNLLKLLKGEKYYFQKNDNETYPRTIQVPMSPTEIPVCTETIEAWGTITSTSIISDYNGISLSCNADITYQAGKKISLKPGFKVTSGTHFLAHIVPMPITCQPVPGQYDFSQFPDVGNTETLTGDLRISTFSAGTKFLASEINDTSSIFDNSISVYPNPAEEILNIETSLKNYNINLYNQLGQIELSKNNISGNTSLILNMLPTGFYYLTVSNISSFCITEKILIK